MPRRFGARVPATFSALFAVLAVGITLAYRAGREPHAASPGSAVDWKQAAAVARRRVVALSLAAEEIILDIAGAERLAAVTPWARDPRYSNVADKTAAVAETVNGRSLERLLALEPDCIWVATYTDYRMRELLHRLRFPVFELPEFRSFGSIRTAIANIGATLGASDAAGDLARAFDARLKTTRERVERAIAQRGAPVEALFLGADPFSPWTAGRDTLVDDILRTAGARNVAVERGDLRYELSLKKETLLEWNPEVLVLEGEPSGQRALLETLAADSVFGSLQAVREGRVTVIPTRLIISTSHYAAAAVEFLADAFYSDFLPPRGAAVR